MRRWASALAALAVLAGVIAAVASDAGARPRDARLARVHTWAFAIGDGDLAGNLARRYAGYDLVVLDGEGVTRAQVSALHRAGTLVLGYLDVGTIEAGRSWYAQVKRYRMDLWGEWGEWYADVDAAGFRDVIVHAVAPAMLAKGLDGLFLDNTDMIESHPRQTSGMRTLVRALAGLAHHRGELLFAQNGEASIGPLLGVYDGWNREDVSATYDFGSRHYVRQSRSDVRTAQGALRRIAAAGLLVLATDYVGAGDRAATAQSIADACAAGALPFVSDIALTRVPRVPARCAQRGAGPSR